MTFKKENFGGCTLIHLGLGGRPLVTVSHHTGSYEATLSPKDPAAIYGRSAGPDGRFGAICIDRSQVVTTGKTRRSLYLMIDTHEIKQALFGRN